MCIIFWGERNITFCVDIKFEIRTRKVKILLRFALQKFSTPLRVYTSDLQGDRKIITFCFDM